MSPIQRLNANELIPSTVLSTLMRRVIEADGRCWQLSLELGRSAARLNTGDGIPGAARLPLLKAQHCPRPHAHSVLSPNTQLPYNGCMAEFKKITNRAMSGIGGLPSSTASAPRSASPSTRRTRPSRRGSTASSKSATRRRSGRPIASSRSRARPSRAVSPPRQTSRSSTSATSATSATGWRGTRPLS